MTSTVDAESITALAEDTTRLLTAMPDAVIVCDKTGRIVFANANVTHLLGYEPEELKGERVEMLVPGVARAHHTDRRERYMRQSLTRPMSAGGDLEASHKSGNTIPVSISLSPLTEAGQAFVIAAIRDETKARELSAALAREAEERAALADLSRAISSSLDIQQVCARLSEHIAPVIPFDRIVFSSFDPERRTFTDIYIGGFEFDRNDRGRVTRLTHEQVKTLESMREPIVSTAENPNEFLMNLPDQRQRVEAGFVSVMYIPIIWNDRLIGTLNLRSRQPDAYDARHVEFGERIAAQIAGAITNAGLHQQTLLESEERSVLSEIGRIITSSPNIEEIFGEFARQVVRLIPADRISICRVWPEIGKYSFDYEWGLLSEPGFAEGSHDLAQSVTGLVAKTGQATLIDEIQARACATPDCPGNGDPGHNLRSWLGVPLVSSGKTIGVMHIRTTTPDAYGERELAVAEHICAQIAGAIANARLHQQTVEEAAERQVVAEIGRIISSSLDINQGFERFTERLRALIPADRVAVDYVDVDRGTFTARFVWGIDVPARRPGTIVPLQGSFVGLVIESGENLLVGNSNEFEEITQLLPLSAPGISAGMQSQIAVRLIASDRPIGMLHIQSYSPDSLYTEADLARAERLAAPVAAAIDNARLHEEAQREARERAVLAEIGVTVSQDLNLENVYERVADQIKDLIAHDRLAINLVEPETGHLRVRFTRGTSIPGSFAGAVIRPPRGDHPPEWEWRSQLQSELVDPSIASITAESGLVSKVEVPLGTEAGGPIGYLSLQSKQANAYSEIDLDLLGRIAIHITPAIQNAVAFEQTVTLAQERQRSAELEAQARELARVDRERSRFLTTVTHELKTPLTSLVAFADVLARNRDGNLTDRQRQQVDVMRRSARRLDVLIDDLLDVSRMDARTFQVQLQEFDGQDFFEELTRSFAPLMRAKSQRLLQHIPQDRLWLNADQNRLAQVVTNLVRNASKYSPEGSEIELDVSREQRNLSIRIRDHGIGISAKDQQHLFSPFFRADNQETRSVDGTGLGLFIVKTIVELHGGTVIVESEENAGTAVIITLPCLMDGPSDAFLKAERAAALPSKPKSRLE